MITNQQIRQANKMLRDEDSSGLYPFYGRYNVTDRAIRSVSSLRKEQGEFDHISDYVTAVRQAISDLTVAEVAKQGKGHFHEQVR